MRPYIKKVTLENKNYQEQLYIKKNPPIIKKIRTYANQENYGTPDRPRKLRTYTPDNMLNLTRERKQGLRYIKKSHDTSVDKLLNNSQDLVVPKERFHFKKAVIYY